MSTNLYEVLTLFTSQNLYIVTNVINEPKNGFIYEHRLMFTVNYIIDDFFGRSTHKHKDGCKQKIEIRQLAENLIIDIR